MSKVAQRFFFVIVFFMIAIYTIFPIQQLAKAATLPALQSLRDENPEQLLFNELEQNAIDKSQNVPIKMGIIPHAFPLSACPPEVPNFSGINVEMLSYIMLESGLKFEYCRVPTEIKTPYKALMDGHYMFVAGSIRLDNYVNDSSLLLSERFCDGSAICIAKRGTNPEILKTGNVAVMSGYQAGIEFSQKQFPYHKIVSYSNNDEVVEAVRKGKADIAMISRYVGVYKLQSPLNEKLTTLTPYQMLIDSVIMGKNTSESKVIMSIINKVILQMGEDEYNNMQMNFSITNPYVLSFKETLYKYRHALIVGLVVFVSFAFLLGKLLYTQKERKLLSRDELTGAMSEAGFELTAAKLIAKSNRQLFITDFDVCYFSNYNELYGKAKGDEFLKQVVKIVVSFLCEKDMICRAYADNFKVLTCKDDFEGLKADIIKATEMFNEIVDRKMIFNFGVYPVSDKSIPITKMLDFAALAKKQVKGNAEDFVGLFDNTLYERHLKEATLISVFDDAIKNKEFIAYYQPQFDAITKEIVGAEALVRWKKSDGTLIPPNQFIDLFERNGQIQRLDLYMLEQVCIFQKMRLEQEKMLIPISVNFSRNHFYSTEFVPKVNAIVERYGIPKNFIEIECTETAMTYDTALSKEILTTLRQQGFTVAMDDFGKAYSSLNSLRFIPLDIIKMDSDFLVSTQVDEKIKAKKIISNIVALAHDLSLKIIAEGVETELQYQFLKSVSCDYIQGYYFCKPLSEQDFLKLIN